MKKVIAHPAPKPLSKNAPVLGVIAAIILAAMLLLQLFGTNKIIAELSTQFDGHDGWAVAVTIIALLTEIVAIPFLLRMKLSHLARVFSGVAAVLAPWIWVLVIIWSIGLPNIAAVQFGIAGCFNIGWWLLAVNILWLIFNFYTVRQLNIESVWYKATGLKPRSELKKDKNHKK
jgi:hypothetical protein